MAVEIPAFRSFIDDHPDLPRRLLVVLNKEYGQLSEALAAGVAQDWSDYKERIGILRGLRLAMACCEEMEEKLRE